MKMFNNRTKVFLLVCIFFVALCALVVVLNFPVANGEEMTKEVIAMQNPFDITPYLIGFLSLLALFLSTWLIPMIKSKTTLEQQEIIQAGANIVVYAAEQLFGTKKGEEKLAYAMERLQKFLKRYGIKIDNYALRPYIEAAVKELNLIQETGEKVQYSTLTDLGPVEGLADFIRSDDEGK